MTTNDQLRGLAGKATAGPWERLGIQKKIGGEVGLTVATLDGKWFFWSPLGATHNSQAQCIRDMDFIAAANPARILALLDELDGLRATITPSQEHGSTKTETANG